MDLVPYAKGKGNRPAGNYPSAMDGLLTRDLHHPSTKHPSPKCVLGSGWGLWVHPQPQACVPEQHISQTPGTLKACRMTAFLDVALGIPGREFAHVRGQGIKSYSFSSLNPKS